MTLQSPTATLIPLFFSSEHTGCGYPGLLDRKDKIETLASNSCQSHDMKSSSASVKVRKERRIQPGMMSYSKVVSGDKEVIDERCRDVPSVNANQIYIAEANNRGSHVKNNKDQDKSHYHRNRRSPLRKNRSDRCRRSVSEHSTSCVDGKNPIH